MASTCIIRKHAPIARTARNQGFEFSRCRQCDRDLVRSNREWKTVPKGFRVVWKEARRARCRSDAIQLLLDLPTTGRDLALFSAQDRSPVPGRVVLALLLAAVRYALWALVDRLQAWRHQPRSRVRRGAVLQLPST
jgi:hypothetical protein